jgi:hypothetical protein
MRRIRKQDRGVNSICVHVRHLFIESLAPLTFLVILKMKKFW